MIELLILAVVSGLALLNRDAVWLAAALCAGWGASFIMEQRSLYDWIPYVDAVVFWLLMLLPAGVSCSRRTLVIGLQGSVMVTHLAYWWEWCNYRDYGNEYKVALFCAYVVTMVILALGNFNVRSFVGAVLQGLRGFLDRSPRLGVAHCSPRSQTQDKGR